MAAPARACSDALPLTEAVTKGDIASALRFADTCVAEDRAASPPPDRVTSDTLLTVFTAFYWELARATFHAKLGDPQKAEQALQRAVQWAQTYALDNPQGIVPVVPLTDATRGYLAERRGDRATAVRSYEDADRGYPNAAAARLALVALEAGDEQGARAHADAALKIDPAAPTALYVLGVLAQRRNANETAAKYYELAYDSIVRAGQRGPSFPLHYLEQDRIAQARAAVPRP